MAGRSTGAVVTRYAGIQVQTSALGVNIPVGWGTFRCKCNLVWYGDFKSVAQKAATGKGGTTTGFSYSASLILAICEGPIDAITQVWVDSNDYINGSKTALAQANLNLSTGAVGQPVWSFLTSNHASQAIGYSGLAIAYQSNYQLDSGASTPNHSFEVKRTSGFGAAGSPDADPSLVVADFFTNTRTGVPGWAAGLIGDLTQFQDYCLAAGLLVSPVIDSQRSASDFMTELLKATNSTCVWSEGVLKFIPYGDTALSGGGRTYTPQNTPVYSLNDDNFVVDVRGGEPPLAVDIMDQSDAYNVVQLEYLDRTNQYNMAIALASDAANVAQYGMRRKDPDTVHVICDPNVAAVSAQLFLQRTLYIRAQYKFKLAWTFALLEPGDIVELTDPGLGLAAYPVRIIQIDEDEQFGLALIAEDYPVGVSHAPLYTLQQGVGFQVNRNLDPGGVEANLLLWSEALTNSYWSTNNASIAAGVASDQYGLASADALAPSTAVAEHVVLATIPGCFAGQNYTYSVCLQQNAHAKARIRLQDGGFVDGVFVEVDLAAGAIITPATVVGAAVLVAASINPTLVAGIWQIVITAQIPATTLQVAVSALSDGGALAWAADGSNAINISQQALRQGVAAGVYARTAGAVAGPQLFNPPSVLTSGGVQVWAAVAGGPNWGGANVWTSVDGSNYQQVGTIDAPARYGSATASLPAHADPDTTDSLPVDLGPSGGGLTGASQATADNGGTLCLIDNELICFETATLTNPSRYDLTTYLRRGYLGSGVAAHAAGAPFVRLDSAIFEFPYLATNAGQTISVKFQSFNAWGGGVVPLSDCNAYPIVPVPMAAAAPGSAAWTATGTTLSNNGQSIPAIVITGASDNPSATGIDFEYRVTGSSVWASAGIGNANTTRKEITSVQSAQSYDASVLYIVNGVPSNREIIATGIAVGSVSVGAQPGSVLLVDSVPGGGKSFTCPPGPYAHVDIILTGAGGAGNFASASKSVTYFGGGGGGTAVSLSFAVTPGSTAFTYTLPSSAGSAATCAAPGLAAMTANGGTSASTSASGTGGAASGGATQNFAGHNGGLTDAWDGGGAATASGGFTDQTTNAQPGLAPGGGGAGAAFNASTGAFTPSPGAGAAIQIIARS